MPSTPPRHRTLTKIIRVTLSSACLLLAACAAPHPHSQHERVYPDIAFASPQGHDLHMDLYVPESQKPVPVVVWIFGGSWKFGSNAYHVNVRDLTKSGIAVASIQYRLSGIAKYPAQLEDCQKAVQWLRENGKRYGIAPQRIGVSGESAGGHLAALLGTVEGKSRIRAVFAMYPPTDLVALSHHDSGLYHSDSIEKLLGGPVEQKQALAREASPTSHVSHSSPPFLIIHGARDKVVPIEQSRKLETLLQRAGVPVRFIVVSNKGHWFRLNDQQLAEVAEFFRTQFDMPQEKGSHPPARS